MLIKINHPMANEISVQQSTWHMCTPTVSSEIAFFMNGRWVVEIIPHFRDFAEYSTGDTRVYGWVPNEMIDEFLKDCATL